MGTMHLPVGTTLQGGKYKIVRFLSSGGFGCTYEAEHVMLKEKVAIKEFFVKDFCNRDESTAHVTVGTTSKRGLVDKLRNKFIDEARALYHLQHPNIVRVSDVFEENGTAYFVMDFIDGSSLSDILKREGHLSEQRALKYIRQVADALQYVHANNRLHLDVKPGNIMIDKQDNAVLIDFGTSKQYDEADGENTSTLMGKTPGYAPLEQMGNDVVKFTPATDIYALGATLYKLLTGITPMSATLIASGDTLAPLPDTVSKNVADAVSAAMQTNKTKRPQTIDDFLAIINSADNTIKEEDVTIIDRTPTQPHVAPTAKKPQSSKKGKPFPIKTVAIVACLVIAIIGFVLFLNHGDSDEKRVAQIEETTVNEDNSKQGDMMPDVDRQRIGNSVGYLYKNLKGEGYNIKSLGDNEDVFYEKMGDPEYRSKIYDWVSRAGDIERLGLGTYTEFEAKYGAAYARSAGDIWAEMRENAACQQQNVQTATTSGYINGHKYVELGLSVKWATYNIGAESPSDYGGYYAWGETSTKSEYTEENSKTYGKSIGNIAGDPQYDAATANWGSPWRMPTRSEIEELVNKCTRIWTTQGGHNGYKITGPNGNSIFLPASGWRNGTSLYYAGEYGFFWSATPGGDDADCAYYLGFYSDNLLRGWICRNFGRSVRPVTD